MSARNAFVLFIFLAALFAAPASLLAEIRVQDPRIQEVARQKQQNKDWEKEARDLEADYVKLADQHFRDKEFQKAAEYYRKALNITYLQWDQKDIEVGGIKMTQPGLRKHKEKLNTGYTRTARDRLEGMQDTLKNEALKAGKKDLDELFDLAEVAMLREEPVRAYGVYNQLIEVAGRMGDNKEAVQSAIKAKVKQKEILAQAAKPLDEAQKLVDEGKAAEASAKIREFNETYAGLADISDEIKDRLRSLSRAPEILQAGREEDAQKRILIGDTALLREDYVGAVRHYRYVVTTYPGTASARTAGEKLAAMMNDPTVAAAVESQETEIKCRTLLGQAETYRVRRQYTDARAICEHVVAEYPDTEWAKKAAEMLAEIKQSGN